MKFLSKNAVDNGAIFNLGDGTSLEANMDAFSDEIITKLAIHGLLQKIGDAASGFSKTSDYHGAMNAMNSVWETLLSGQWTRTGAGSGTTDLVTALANLTGKDTAIIQVEVDKWDDEKMKAIKARKDVKAEVKRIQLARAEAAASASNVDSESLEDLF
jgi:hypothetical protein